MSLVLKLTKLLSNHSYEYGGVPPAPEATAIPSEPPAQTTTLDCARDVKGNKGTPICTVSRYKQLLSSTTET